MKAFPKYLYLHLTPNACISMALRKAQTNGGITGCQKLEDSFLAEMDTISILSTTFGEEEGMYREEQQTPVHNFVSLPRPEMLKREVSKRCSPLFNDPNCPQHIQVILHFNPYEPRDVYWCEKLMERIETIYGAHYQTFNVQLEPFLSEHGQIEPSRRKEEKTMKRRAVLGK